VDDLDGSPAEARDAERTRQFRRASRAAFASALLLPALATVGGLIPEWRGGVITGTLLLPLLFGAMLANLLGWHRTMAAKSRIYLAVGLVFTTWSAAEVADAIADGVDRVEATGSEHRVGRRDAVDAAATRPSPVQALPRPLADGGHAGVAQLALDGDRVEGALDAVGDADGP
jgi:hypothetical protein